MTLEIYACEPCQQRKKRCSKQLPACGLCARMKRPCKYPQQRKPRIQSRGVDSGDQVSTEGQTNRFPPAFFIDPYMFHSCSAQIPQSRVTVPTRVIEYLEDAILFKNLAAGFFATVHQWMPVISRIRLHSLLTSQPLHQQEPDAILLLLSIKLILSVPEQNKSVSEIYVTTKQFFLMVETAGCLTLQLVQAGLMISLYELGHGIYPAAFSTIATCARYGTALGIDDLAATDLTSAGGEEKLRVWWGILIVDHILNVGTHGRHLSTRGPKSDQPLPMDDDDWDRLIPKSKQPQLLSAPTELKAGRFARTAQATNLLSLVFQYLNRVRSGLQPSYEHLDQLNRTILALGNLVEEEGYQRGIVLCCPVGFCSNALLLLNTPHLDGIPPAHLTDEQRRMSEQIAISETRKVKNIAEQYENGKRGTLNQTCPLLLSWLYRAAITTTSLRPVIDGGKNREQVLPIHNTVKDISQRWHVADSYLQLLETRQFMTLSS
ncbi:Zn(2)-C6 fungal-type domain-containing protein [Trichoderma simmonsii]|uniref:Zn(2)-C6 fungal-type domain-containing protein n=1 Tax=Trichoderma simmonsii TaxID=1491479 RepID=A0A8G0KZ14_9HYPO|nr:Zn(2)-C6 fungal-type domain-containing protein [Trichoderma simmonsii]